MTMTLVLARMGIFIIFLMTAAWQDLKAKQIRIWVLCLAGMAAVVFQVLTVFMALYTGEESVVRPMIMAGGAALYGDGSGTGSVWEVCLPYLSGLLPGVALLGFSWLSQGIGTGDGCFFLVSGLLLGLADNLLLLCGAVFSSGLFGLGYYVFHCVNRCQNRNNDQKRKMGIGKTEFPFLPFAVVPGIGIVVSRLVQMGILVL